VPDLVRSVKGRLSSTRWLASLLPDEIQLKWRYEGRLGKRLDLAHPRTFNEKLQWLKLYWRDPRCPTCVDKLAVRAYVEERCGPGVLNALHGVYPTPEDIDLDALPRAFVLRATHGSGFNVICPDRSRLDWDKACTDLRRWLRHDFGRLDREWPYAHVPRQILCERYLGREGRPPDDYKLFCFDGEPRFVEVHTGRGTDPRMALHDLEWNSLEVALERPPPDRPAPRPHTLRQMLLRARQLAAGFPFVRVDLYQVEGRVVFGELTFFPTAGMKVFGDPADDLWMGEHLRLPTPSSLG